ncbi:MAG: sigma 54-interacting transcriptional regulator, partial [Myxococcota bacterium]
LFLDEIGDLPLSLQPKLLRALQEGEVQPVGSTKLTKVDVRVVAATNHQLAERVERGEFRRDLYARLALWELRVPPMNARRGDLLGWIDRLHAVWRERRPHVQSEPLTFAPEAAEALLLAPWANNLREIDRLVHELGAAAPEGPVTVEQLPTWLRDTQAKATGPTASTTNRSASAQAAPAPDKSDKPPLPTREEFTAVFEQLEGNVRAMAKHFGRDRRQIYRWIDAHGLSDRRPRSKD